MVDQLLLSPDFSPLFIAPINGELIENRSTFGLDWSVRASSLCRECTNCCYLTTAQGGLNDFVNAWLWLEYVIHSTRRPWTRFQGQKLPLFLTHLLVHPPSTIHHRLILSHSSLVSFDIHSLDSTSLSTPHHDPFYFIHYSVIAHRFSTLIADSFFSVQLHLDIRNPFPIKTPCTSTCHTLHRLHPSLHLRKRPPIEKAGSPLQLISKTCKRVHHTLPVPCPESHVVPLPVNPLPHPLRDTLPLVASCRPLALVDQVRVDLLVRDLQQVGRWRVCQGGVIVDKGLLA